MIKYKKYKTIFFFILVAIPFLCFLVGYIGSYYFLQKQFSEVPQIVGKQVEEAFIALARQGLSMMLLKEQESLTVKEGIVLKQIPDAGQHIRLNKSVYVVITKKPLQKKAPYCLEKDLDYITNLCKKNGLTPHIHWLASNYSKDLCFAQFPSPDEPMVNNEVLLYFSLGSDSRCLLPNFRGQELDTIKQYLDTCAITYDVITQSNDQLTVAGKIMEQRPYAGSFVNMKELPHMQFLVR